MSDEPSTWTQPSDIAAAWRSLTTDETSRAAVLIGQVERYLIRTAIRRGWGDIQTRITAGLLDVATVKDVVIWLVFPVLSNDPTIASNVRQEQRASGTEQTNFVYAGPSSDGVFDLEDWMVEALSPASDAPAPAGSFPRPAPIDRILSPRVLGPEFLFRDYDVD